MDAEDKKEIEALFKHHVGVLVEAFQHKLDIVVEGRQMVSDKIDRLDEKVERVEVKVDAIATGLAAHRADTEAHQGVYRVKEGGE
jgi:transcription initiation factor IIF auxiliary subunit